MVTIRLLGNFFLCFNDQKPILFNSERLQSLLVYLMLHRDAPQPRQQIAFRLWPDSSESQARSNLRNLLFTLRQVLPEIEQLLTITNTALQWDPQVSYSLDVAEFDRLLVQAREAAQIQTLSEERLCLERAVDLYQGELTPGNYDDWIFPLREKLHQDYQDALSRLVTLLEQLDDPRAALRYAQRMIREDPLDETAYIHLMRLHARNGDRTGVRRVYEQCIDVLLRELDVPPADATVAAYEEAMRLSASSVAASPLPTPAPFVPAFPAPRRQTLPMPSAPFLGRERELAELATLLGDPNCRLITILGPGGIGKTHLALQTARAHQRVFADGVLFVSLATVSNVEQVLFAIASALGISFHGTSAAEEQLYDALRERELLLVLDSFEHLLPASDLLVDLLTNAPRLKILVTSRERIHVQEEWVYLLYGLPLPADEPATWADNHCVALFVQMARKVQSSFALSEQNQETIVHICRLVEGMPLAIQLAASWVRVLSPAEIAQEIERNLEFLTASHRNLPERHRSLRAVFDQSWSLLSPSEQQIYSQLAIFRGHFSREAAESVAGADLFAFTALLDKSLVRNGNTGRYSLHEMLRHFAEQKLFEGPLRHATQQRHAHFYLSFLHEQESHLYSAEQVAMMEAIQVELPNVQAAWRWAADNGDVEGIFMALRPLFYFYFRRSRYQEGAQDLGYALERVQTEEPTPFVQRLLGRLFTRQGMLLHVLGRYEEARAHLVQGMPLLRRYGDEDELATTLVALGHALDDLGEMAQAEALLHEGLALARARNNVHRIAVALDYLCYHHWRRGEHDQAKAYIEECIALYRQSGDLWGLAHALNNKANSSSDASELRAAIDIYEESLSIYRQLGNQGGVALALNNLGHSYMLLGDYELAWTHLDQSLAIQRQIGGALRIARTLNNKGHVAYLLGRTPEARRLSEESLSIRRAMGTPLEVANSLYTLGLIVSDMGERAQAEIHWREALALYERIGYAAEVENCRNALAQMEEKVMSNG